MEKTRLIPLAVLVCAGVAAADETCRTGGDGTGVLEFRAVQDGDRFTGQFTEFEVEYCWPGDRPAAGAIRVAVRPASASTDNRDRDQTLESGEFFDVDRFPESTWTSTSIEATGEGYRAGGELTIKQVTRDQPVTFTLEETGDGWRMRGESELMRLDYDVGTGEYADTGFISNRVGISFDLLLEQP